MSSIYLLRHCEYSNSRGIIPGRLPVPLSEEGQAHAERLADYFTDKSIAKIYSSPVVRCEQTAQIVAKDRMPVIFDQRLLETFSAFQGFWEENRYGNRYHFYSHQDELGGEMFVDVQRRMASFWDEITQGLQENIIVCSHGDPLLTLYAYIHDLPLVDEHTEEALIPGWLNKGDFVEVIWNEGKIVKTSDVRSDSTGR